MQSIHLEEVDSTQSYLKQNYHNLHQEILVSTSHQTGGHGRRGTTWKHLDQALAFSFTLNPNEELTLTPLEVGCLLAEFFSPVLNLKWPNDLINDRKEKVGGIICQLVGDVIVVGVGINLYIDPTEHFNFPYPIGGLFKERSDLKDNFHSTLPIKLYHYILKNRLSAQQVSDNFIKYCSHLNQHVQIIDHDKQYTGYFLGISTLGEAIIQLNGKRTNILTGSLRLRE